MQSRNWPTRLWLLVSILLISAFPGAARAVAEPSRPALQSVTLYTSGVGHFVHSGSVHGNAEIRIPVPRGQFDDVLKSLTVEDVGGGSVRSVTYDVVDPVSRSGIALDPTVTLLSLLQGLYGEPVSIGPDGPHGVLVAAEPAAGTAGAAEPAAGAVGAAEGGGDSRLFLTLLTDQGLQSAGVATATEIRFADSAVRRKLAEALAQLKQSRAGDTRDLVLTAEGRGTRTLRISYVREVPVWKATYRLAIGEGENHLLQGWALVENPGSEPWQDVALTLVAGDPVAFHMPLAAPIYRNRPEVPFPLPDQPLPPEFGDTLWGRGGAELAAPAPETRRTTAREALSLDRGVEAATEAVPQGTLQRYEVRQPVSLAGGSAAMVPIVQARVPAALVSVYDPQTHASLPVAGVQLTNATGASLSAGPMVVYERGGYAGEAVLHYLGEGNDRLISFQLDPRTEISRRTAGVPERITEVRINRGVMTTVTALRREHRYGVASRDATPRTLLIQHRREGDWRLVQPARADQEYADGYRFEMKLDAAETQELVVVEERAREERVSLTTVSRDRIAGYLAQRELPAAVRTALRRIAELQAEHAEAQAALSAVEQQRDDIYGEQERIRANMGALDQTAALYRRYVNELTAQEDRLGELRSELTAARAEEQRRRRALESYIAQLVIE